MGICGGQNLEEDCFLDDNPSLSSNINIDFVDDIYFSRTIKYYIFIKNVFDPFYKEIKGLTLASKYRLSLIHI